MGINRTQAKTVVVARGDVSANIMVMQNGAIVEEGDARQLLAAPATDYTRTLLAAIPHPPQAAAND
mgnify:CR=1 FL=1